MSETFDEKLEQFERLWDSATPRGLTVPVPKVPPVRANTYYRSTTRGVRNNSRVLIRVITTTASRVRISFSLRRTAASTGWRTSEGD